MDLQTLAARVERLDNRVTKLEELPARIDALTLQVSQLREEMHVEFSAIQTGLRAEIRAGDEETRRVLRGELRGMADEIMGQARMLYEDLRADWAKLQEGRPPRQPLRNRPAQK